MLKKLDLFLIKSYVWPLIATFFISLFVLLMQFLWKYIDDLVGKGLDASVIAELMLYASAGLIPMALPLAILLASIMTFGNLGEKFELTAIKAAGISLQRAMKPLIYLSIAISLGAFFIANNLIPYTNLKFSALLYSIKGQRPELNIKPGIFNNDLDNFSIRISEKNPVTNMMYDFMVYEHTKGKGNTTVTLADSGMMKMTDDNRYMLVTLYDGVRYEESDSKDKNAYPQRKDKFSTQTIVFNLAGFDFNKTDENLFRNNYQVKNVEQLQRAIDSMTGNFNIRTENFSSTLNNRNYMRNGRHSEQHFIDSINAKRKNKSKNHRLSSVDNPEEMAFLLKDEDTAYLHEDSIIKAQIAENNKKMMLLYSTPIQELESVINLDSLYLAMPTDSQRMVLTKIKEFATETQNLIIRNCDDFSSRRRTIAKYRNAWHQKFTLSIACLIFFFIGAPLGAIIRKGGFGVPIVVSVIVFIIYYIISTAGMKMSREGVWEPWQGMWISSIIILPIGIFLTYKATVDAQLFNIDAYKMFFEKIVNFFKRKNVDNSKTV